MITEDYVSFEVAKLLKEKGFDGIVTNSYDNYTLEFLPHCAKHYGQTNAPTLQMAMKWLREVYNIHIEVKYFFEPHIYKYTITYTPVALDNISSHPQCFNTYEEASETAIKYCLEELI